MPLAAAPPRVPPVAIPTSPAATRTAAPPPARTGPGGPLAPVHRGDLTAYRGVGTWVDAYDFSREYGGRTPASAVDAMARAGVKTIYLQAAKAGQRSPRLLLSEDRLAQWLTRAHARGLRVVAWYLPLFEDPARDRAHLQAILDFRASGHRFDGLGVDIEWRGVADVRVRNERLVALTQWLRRTAPQLPLAGIVVAPVVTEVVNRRFWSPFPWKHLHNHYDVWMTMGYWTDRKASSGWRDPYRYTVENVRHLRARLERPAAPVHVIGGIGAGDRASDAQRFTQAAVDTRSTGLSLYDWPTSGAAPYAALARGPR